MHQVESNDVRELADALGETDAKALADLERVLGVVGKKRAFALVAEAREVHARGPAHLDDGPDDPKRPASEETASLTVTASGEPRTLGGVFFQLARPHLPRTEPPQRKRRLRWHQAAELAAQAQQPERTPNQKNDQKNDQKNNQTGVPGTVKITLIGRPGRVVKRDNVVVTTMHNHQRPSLPKQLPKLSGADVETRYTVFIAARQWSKVETAIYEDKDDQLIIEGYPFLDPDVAGICVFARSTTTKLLQRAAREAQRAEREQKGS